MMVGHPAQNRGPNSLSRVPIPSETYDRDYFLSDYCEGYERFREDRGLSPLKQRLLELLGPAQGVSVLDAGCGRGELLLACAERGASVAGVDYSEAAVELTQETLAEVDGARVERADLTSLPFPGASFDRALLGDVIEHLDPEQEPLALAELRRVLRPGGLLVVHTAPNRYFLKFGWPPARFAMRLSGHGDTAGRMDAWIAESGRVHVNEQSLPGLRRQLRRAGFGDVRAWIDADVLRGGEHHLTHELVEGAPSRRLAVRLLGSRPLRLLFGNDIYATARA
jgi:ubiquinone/menaquinone biosynthesis C-methylase UbiE